MRLVTMGLLALLASLSATPLRAADIFATLGKPSVVLADGAFKLSDFPAEFGGSGKIIPE